jgi:hypothetical protein
MTSPDSIDLALARLRAETDSNARNAMALNLAESHDPRVLAVLLELIERPELANQRGTLVYCLHQFDVAGHLVLLTQLVLGGNWEVAHEAFSVIAAIDQVDGAAALASFGMLESAASQAGLDDWRAVLIADLLSMFE